MSASRASAVSFTKLSSWLPVLALVALAGTGMVRADEEPAPTAESNAASIGSLLENANILWTCLAAFLVFFMQAGFALVEAGLTRAKNTCNILMKNLMDFAVGSIAFWAIGFGLMFGLTTSGWIGGSGFFFDAEPMAEATGKSIGFSWAFLIFQTVFAATAATIVSGPWPNGPSSRAT